MEGESRAPSDTRVIGRRVGADSTKHQGFAPGTGASGAIRRPESAPRRGRRGRRRSSSRPEHASPTPLWTRPIVRSTVSRLQPHAVSRPASRSIPYRSRATLLRHGSSCCGLPPQRLQGILPRPWRTRMNAISAANNCSCTYVPEKFRGFTRALAIISQKDALSLRLVSSSSLSG